MDQSNPTPPSSGTSLTDTALGIYGPSYKLAEKKEKDIEEGIKKIDSEPAPKPPTLTEAPKPENYHTDQMQTFGSAAMFLATFGSLLTKQPLTNSLNAGAAVLKAKNQGDAIAFKQATDKWKFETDNAWKMANWQQEVYKAAISKDEAELKMRAASFKDEVMLHMADAKMAQQVIRDRDKQLKKGQEAYEKINDIADGAYKKAIKEGKSTEVANMRYMEAYGSAINAMKGKVDVDSTAIDWKNAKDTDPVPKTGLTIGAIRQIGDGIVKTGNYQQAGLGYGWNPAKQAVDNYLAQVHPDFNRANSALGYLEKQTAVKIGAKNAENLNIAVNNLDNSLPLLEEQVKKVDPSQFKSWNEFENYLNEHTGDPGIIDLKNAVADTKADFSMVLARGGQVTDTVRETANDTLNYAFSSGQFEGAMDIMRRTGVNQKAAAKQSMREAKTVGDNSSEREEQTIDGVKYYKEDGKWYAE
jgi:hypothetical protein